MRAFILVALLAMAATVSCQDIVVSPACNASSNALEVASVSDAEKGIVKGGCKDIEYDLKSTQCTYDNTTSIYTCNCVQTLTNTSGWETAVRNISNGRPCYLDLTFTLTGTVKVDNVTTKPFTFNATQTNYDTIPAGGNCTDTEIGGVFASSVAAGVTKLVDANLNSDSATTGVTWSTVTATASGCGVSRTSAVTTIPQSTGGTTAPPTTPSGTTTTPPTVPPSSTGKSGASIIAFSFALVASLIAAVTILA